MERERRRRTAAELHKSGRQCVLCTMFEKRVCSALSTLVSGVEDAPTYTDYRQGSCLLLLWGVDLEGKISVSPHLYSVSRGTVYKRKSHLQYTATPLSNGRTELSVAQSEGGYSVR